MSCHRDTAFRIFYDTMQQASTEAKRGGTSIRVKGRFYQVTDGEMNEHIDFTFDIQATPTTILKAEMKQGD